MSSRSRDSEKRHKREFARSTKGKNRKKLLNLIGSDSDTEGDSEHELSYYIEDRVKLMKEVLKTIKPRKIKSMAPDCIKNLEPQEINSMLLEELLGISKKRLKYIFEGKILDEESSTDEDQPIDVISLDDISDDDFVVISDDEARKPKGKHKRRKIKEEPKERSKKMKKEKPDKERIREIERVTEKINHKGKVSSKDKETIGEENLMSVLELLELQARARAIRSQLELENKRKQEEQQKQQQLKQNNHDDDDEIIIEIPQEVEIIITSSDSENEERKAGSSQHNQSNECTNDSNIQPNDEVSQDSSTNNVPDQAALVIHQAIGSDDYVHSISDKEEGEVLVKQTQCHNGKNEKRDRDLEDNKLLQKEIASNEMDSDSSSNDNLQVVMEREKLKKDGGTMNKNSKTVASPEYFKAKDSSKTMPERTETNEKVSKNRTQPQTTTEEASNSNNKELSNENSKTSHSEKMPESSQSKIDTAIKKFIELHPPTANNFEEQARLEQEEKEKEEKYKRKKEKRLKGLKNKLQSFKEDVAVESSSVTVLKNIVIKPNTINYGSDSNKHLDDCDDLVINVDQDDLDCVVCD